MVEAAQARLVASAERNRGTEATAETKLVLRIGPSHLPLASISIAHSSVPAEECVLS